MEKKNTVLLTVIAVATLLVAVVGATFAYFTATSATDDKSQGSTQVNTAKVDSIKLAATSIAGSEKPYYPGTMNYVGTNVIASVVSNSATNVADYEVTYTVAGKVTLAQALTSDVVATLYETDATVASPVACSDVANTTVGTEVHYTQTCNVSALTTAGAQVVATATVKAGQTTANIEKAGLTTQTTDNDGKFYYLVLEYKNIESSQNADQNVQIKGEILTVTATSSEQI